MTICLNLQCNNVVYRKHKIRCNNCRRDGINTCCSCGTDLVNSSARSCYDCQVFRRHFLMERYNDMTMYCMGCEDELRVDGSSASRWCKDCAHLKIVFTNRKTLNCKVCGNSLLGTCKKEYCSKQCYGIFKKQYLIDRRKRKTPSQKECISCFKSINYNISTTKGCPTKLCDDPDCRKVYLTNMKAMYRKNRAVTYLRSSA